MTQTGSPRPAVSFWSFGHCVIRICFGFRISCFEFLLRLAVEHSQTPKHQTQFTTLPLDSTRPPLYETRSTTPDATGQGRAAAMRVGAEEAARRIDAAVEAMGEELVEFLRDIVRIPTENPPGRNYPECAAAIGRKMAAAGLTVETVDVPAELLPTLAPHGEGLPRPSVIGTLAGPSRAPAPALHRPLRRRARRRGLDPRPLRGDGARRPGLRPRRLGPEVRHRRAGLRDQSAAAGRARAAGDDRLERDPRRGNRRVRRPGLPRGPRRSSRATRPTSA